MSKKKKRKRFTFNYVNIQKQAQISAEELRGVQGQAALPDPKSNLS